MHTVRSSPPRPISPMNAMPLGIGNSKKLKKTKFSSLIYNDKE